MNNFVFFFPIFVLLFSISDFQVDNKIEYPNLNMHHFTPLLFFSFLLFFFSFLFSLLIFLHFPIIIMIDDNANPDSFFSYFGHLPFFYYLTALPSGSIADALLKRVGTCVCVGPAMARTC